MLRKAFSTFVSFATILWSVGAGALAFPVTAQAATLAAGDLIKASGPAVYYYNTDGKRYVFPNEKTYFSWFNDFSSVVTITDAELAAIQIGGNVTVRPGTKLVKITTDPKTYAVTKCGTLHWIESEAIAKALWGDAWATRVIDVPDSFFVNYEIGSSISSNVHPNGQLITYAGDNNVFVVWEGEKRLIVDEAAFNANNWNMINVVETTLTYADGANVTGAEPANFWNIACPGTQAVGGDVTVSLASDTPAGATVPKNAMGVPMVKVNVQAGAQGAMLEGLHFHRVGVGSTSDFANVYLYDVEGNRLTTGRSVNSSSNTVEFNSLNQTLAANSMKSYYVYADFNNPATTGGNHAFELMDAASVVLSGSGTVGGSFPVRGNVFVVGTASAGTLTVQAGPVPANPVTGQKNAPISSIRLTASTNDIYVHRVALYQSGGIDNSDLANFELYQGSTLVATTAGVNAKGQIVLTFDTPYLLPNGVTRIFDLKADVSGRAGRTIRTYVEYATDVMAVDSVYNSGAAIDISAFDGTGTNYVEVTTQGGNLTFAFNGPAAGSVAKGKLGVVLYEFSLTSSDNDLEIRNLRTTLASVNGTDRIIGSNGTKYFRNIKIKDMDTGTTVMGPKELTGMNNSPSEPLTFNDTFNIDAGETMNLAIVADLSNSEDAANEFYGDGDNQYQVTWLAFSDGDVKIVETGENLALSKIVPNANTTGNAQTVKQSDLTADLASTPGSDTVVKKSQDKPVVGISLDAGSQSDIKVTNMTLDCQASIAGAAYAANQCAQRITKLALYDGDTLVGTPQAPDTTTGKAQITNMNLLIPAGSTKNLTVKATFSSAASTSTNDRVSVGASSITAQDDEANTLTPTITTALSATQLGATPSVFQTILAKGTLTVSQDAHPASTIVIAGGVAWVPMARYKATAQYENMLIDLMRVESLSGDNSNYTQVAVASGGAVKGAAVFPAGATGTVDISLTGNNVTIPKDGSATFEIWAKLASVQSSSSATGVPRSGSTSTLGIEEDFQTGSWNTEYSGMLNMQTIGEASGERVYAAQGATDGNGMVLRKTKPVVTMQAVSNTTLSAGSRELYRVQVGADSAGSVALKQMVFNISKTANVALDDFRLYRGSTQVPLDDVAIISSSLVNLETDPIPAGVNQAYVVVSFTNEDSVGGTGNVYSLRATVSYTGTGNNVTTNLYTDPASPIVTGYLVNSAFGVFAATSTSIFNLDTAAAPDGLANNLGTFVWSDNSEVPHSSAAQTSRDWTNDTYVEDLTQSQSLSN